ncbi:hypothetical protein GCM10022198_22560 [Klugiella xanthotipulae]
MWWPPSQGIQLDWRNVQRVGFLPDRLACRRFPRGRWRVGIQFERGDRFVVLFRLLRVSCLVRFNNVWFFVQRGEFGRFILWQRIRLLEC